jgi:hypothetical protein
MKTADKEKLMRSIRVPLNQRQKEQLRKRARISGKTVSEEVRSAIDLYLELPTTKVIRTEEDLAWFFGVVSRSAGRIIRKLDETILHVDCVFRPKVKVGGRRVSFLAAN